MRHFFKLSLTLAAILISAHSVAKSGAMPNTALVLEDHSSLQQSEYFSSEQPASETVQQGRGKQRSIPSNREYRSPSFQMDTAPVELPINQA